MNIVEPLTSLLERRAFLCRLTPDRALDTFADAEAFLRDRGLLTRTADCALPSLYAACHEDPYRPGSPGFATWPATKWPWFGELADRGYLVTAVHRGKNMLVTHQIADLLDPICRAEISRMRSADQGARRLLDHLADTGPTNAEDLQAELRLSRRELKALRAALERCGAVLARSAPVNASGAHPAARELIRWDQAYPHVGGGGVEPQRAIAALIAAGIRAAVIAPEAELRRWFSWPWYWSSSLVDELEEDGVVRRVGGYVTTSS